MRIAIVGAGYVGLTTAAGFADFGHEVICADIDEGKIAALCAGRVPFHEPCLAVLVADNVRAGRLSFTTDVAAAVRGAALVFIAVGTPPTPEGPADLRHVLSAAEAIGRALPPQCVVVTKSTVPVGTTERVRDTLAAVTDRPFTVAANPEFLKEGTAVTDFQRPDRVVIGAEEAGTRELLRRLYAPFVRDPGQILLMDIRSAELCKYAANAMLATRISFMNEMANLCEALGADIHHVRQGVGADARIGDQFLYAGVGFGGSCFPKDLQALLATGEAVGAVPLIAEAAWRANVNQRLRFAQKIKRHFGGEVRGRTIAVWGLAFKPGTDDVRDAPALDLIRALCLEGATVRAYDPEAIETARACLAGVSGVVFVQDPYEAARGAEALALLTEWRALRMPDWAHLKEFLAAPVLFDGRNAWNDQAARAVGFTYHGVGRP